MTQDLGYRHFPRKWLDPKTSAINEVWNSNQFHTIGRRIPETKAEE